MRWSLCKASCSNCPPPKHQPIEATLELSTKGRELIYSTADCRLAIADAGLLLTEPASYRACSLVAATWPLNRSTANTAYPSFDNLFAIFWYCHSIPDFHESL